MTKKKKIHVGGQAVLEGVMMRSPDYVSVAVRKPDGKIALKRDKHLAWTKRIKILGLPFVRGGVTLIESMVLGIEALNFSAKAAMEEEKDKKSKDSKFQKFWENLSLVFTMIFAMGMGFLLFFYVPLLITEATGAESSVMFNLIDGVIRLSIFLLYVYCISLWKEMRRVFEYHGAEHVSIFTFEDGKPLTIESAKKYTTHHPRCGTSFLMIVVMVSILVFMFLGKPETVSDRLIRFLFIPVIGGISYEIIKLADTKAGAWLAKSLVLPGLWLQNITTQKPDESQIEVALVALKSSLNQDIDADVELVTE